MDRDTLDRILEEKNLTDTLIKDEDFINECKKILKNKKLKLFGSVINQKVFYYKLHHIFFLKYYPRYGH